MVHTTFFDPSASTPPRLRLSDGSQAFTSDAMLKEEALILMLLASAGHLAR